MIFIIIIIVINVCSLENGFPIFNPKKTHYVYSVNNNYFFRGNYPGGHNESVGNFYDYESLVKSINSVAKSLNLTEFPYERYYMPVIQLFGKGSEYYNKEVEFWKKNPDKGELIWWQMVGTYTNATELTKWKRDENILIKKKWEKIDVDDLSNRLVALKSLLEVKHDTPRVFYAHCFGGIDRTGEFCGSFQMQYQHWSFPEAIKWDDIIKRFKILPQSAQMMNWYCYYLELKLHMSNLKCDDWSTYIDYP